VCDGIITSVGWSPAAHLLYQAGGSLGYDDRLDQLVPRTLPAGVFAAGRVNGVFALAAQLRDAERAAAAACAVLRGAAFESDPGALRASESHSSAWPVVPHPRGRNFVDFDEDLQLRDLLDAAREGFDNIELLKRFSTVGMGPSQGKHANMNAIRILARTLGQDIDTTGSTTARPFYHPLRLDDLAGRRVRPRRTSALHDEHIRAGAVFVEAGAWLRPDFYGDRDRREQRTREEVMAVREGLGLIDVSTLGKIEVLGPDAGRLLDAAYTMRMTTLGVGRTRYALMVDETGVIIDDGVVGRLGEQHYYLTATTTHADATYRLLSRYTLEWGLNARLVNRTGQVAAVNLAGPLSRELLVPLTAIDLRETAFPYLAIRDGLIGDIPARLLRVGFVGELGYEIHVPYTRGAELWQRLMQAGQSRAIRPFGVEAQRRLRLEKGHIIVGQDTDGLTTPFEAAMAWAVHLDKPFFVGRKTLEILAPASARRLVGFRLPVATEPSPVRESHLVIHAGAIAGRVTSVAYSPTLGRVIGLAMVDKALAVPDQTLAIRTTDGALVEAQQVHLPFYDPDGLRQKSGVQTGAAA
jgi:sarcosine oxidase subunit alpha